MIQRLFLATDSPDLGPLFDSDLVKLAADEFWELPIIVANRSSAVGQHTLISIEVVLIPHRITPPAVFEKPEIALARPFFWSFVSLGELGALHSRWRFSVSPFAMRASRSEYRLSAL